MTSEMTPPSPAPDDALRWIESALHVDTQIGHYRTAGTGPIVCVIAESPDGAVEAACHNLARTHRVLRPTWFPGCRRWLGGLLDVFGARGVVVIADEGAWADALELAAVRFDRVLAVRRFAEWNAAQGVSSSDATIPRLASRTVP